jgi:glucan phosphoethanolaminetransferase (alkaline phosphatase superfamily)
VIPGQRALDTNLLLPPLRAALARPAPLKAIVLRANNAHDPYCARCDPAHAPYPSTCMDLGMEPSRANLAAVRDNYANAVDASIGFVDEVFATLDRQPQPAFLVYSPDHGENLLDDGAPSGAIRAATRRSGTRTCPRSSGPPPRGATRTPRSGPGCGRRPAPR